MKKTITPEVGKRYVERGGWITPPLEASASTTHPFCIRMKNGTIFMSWMSDGMANGLEESEFDLIAEYVEPTAPQPADTFRRDLVAKLYVAMIGADITIIGAKDSHKRHVAKESIWMAEILIEELEGKQ